MKYTFGRLLTFSFLSFPISAFSLPYSNNPTPEQSQIIEELTDYSVNMINVGEISSLIFGNISSDMRLNNPTLSSCVDNKFSTVGYRDYKREQISNYVLSTPIYKVKLDKQILTPELQYFIGNNIRSGINKSLPNLPQSSPNIAISNSTKSNLINFLFNPQYSSFKNAISIPSNANISDSAETIKIKMVGAGGELYIRYMTWGFKKCGL